MMETREVKVLAKDGSKHPAKLLICNKCQNEVFHIFYVDDDDSHAHLQCAVQSCGEVFCHAAGKCGDRSEVVPS